MREDQRRPCWHAVQAGIYGSNGQLLERIPTKDLYYLKRVCDDARHFSKKFWWELDAKKHQPSGIDAV